MADQVEGVDFWVVLFEIFVELDKQQRAHVFGPCARLGKVVNPVFDEAACKTEAAYGS